MAVVPGGVDVDRKCKRGAFEVVAPVFLMGVTITVSVMVVDMTTGGILVLSILVTVMQWYGSRLSIASNDRHNR